MSHDPPDDAEKFRIEMSVYPQQLVQTLGELIRVVPIDVCIPSPWPLAEFGVPTFGYTEPTSWFGISAVHWPWTWSASSSNGRRTLLVTGTERLAGWREGRPTFLSRARDHLSHRRSHIRRHILATGDTRVHVMTSHATRREFLRLVRSVQRVDGE
jgi:hypothetical protein